MVSKSHLNSTTDTDNSEALSSLSTAQILSTDHVSSWDVSSIINPSDSNLLTSQSEKIKSEREDYERKNSESHKALESCMPDEDQRIELMKQRKRCNSTRKNPSSIPKPEKPPVKPEMDTVKAQLNDFFSPTNPKAVDQKNMRKSKKMSEMYLSYQVSLGLIKSTLNYPWCDSPVPIVCKSVQQGEQNSNVEISKDNHIQNSINSKIKASENSENIKVDIKDKTETLKEKKTEKSNEKQAKKSKNKQNEDEKTDESDESEEDDEEDDVEDSSESIEENQNIPAKQLVSYPKSSSAIFAAILHTQFLQKNVFGGVYFDSILDNFFKTVEGHKFVKNCTPVDAFTVLIHLLALLEKETIRKTYSYATNKEENSNKEEQDQKDKDNNYIGHLASTMTKYALYEIDKDRYFLFYNRLSNMTIDSFSRLCEHLVDQFAPYINQIFKPKFDPNIVIEGFARCFKEIDSKKSVEREILIIAEDYINEIIDSKMVDYMIKNPKCCTLTNTIQWNYLITSLEAEVPLSRLTLFREACSVIMISKGICDNPVECDEIAPHLPKIIAYTILRNLTSCEYMPELPNPSMFFNYYKSDIASVYLDNLYASDNYLTTSDKMTVTEINEKNIVLPNEFLTPTFEKFEDIISSINTSNWKDIDFTEKEQSSFSFVETIFNNSSN